ncbi:SMI1/KNR4 family protein [Streptomyces dangxiongensis]|uniref:SMI1/KNR4 family protein n=1 Tax=Streptomyces dangxiongensis TaxID=1442032 RepID=A0A3G2JLZ2_9ACTN|nr:SMI1/KNR4 family protein [Streptomyces dangxiongensis]AYN43458.1 SMI1/KNR4 family protein [Streptomyces dangxiongensis]
MTDTTAFDWRSFLLTWSGEWADSLPDGEAQGEDDEAARRARWLGFPPASEERIAALEERLGRRMPPSYRRFLQVSDGWRHAGGFVWLLAGTADARWHDNESGLADMFEEYLDEDAEPAERQEADLWRRGLQLDVESDVTHVLMDPEDVDEDGEWAVYTWASWRAAPPERHANFLEFMREMYREFHGLRARPGDGEPVFVNDTTRKLDSQVAEARLEALRGGWERAGRALDEAREYGRPRAAGLGDQIRRLLGQTYMVYFEDVVTDPRYAPDLLPPLVAEHAAHSYRDDSTLTFHLRGADEDLVSLAYATLEQVRSGTYRYTAAGPFGEAVERARELARWGDTGGAWRTLMNALPLWEPLGPDHLAPLGWVADPLLGPLLSPERGRELLSTPRGGQAGEAPGPAAGPDPGGLAWLAEPDPGNNRTSYRFVLVEGVEPEELPGRLADGDGTELNEPMSFWEARHRSHDRREFSSYDDRALMAVGRAGTGWSFAFDGDPAPFHRQRFVSPAAAAGADTRAVVVWSGLRSRHGEPFFHLSVARDGAEQYAFTYADGEIRRSGEIPRALDPSRFLGAAEDGAEVERSLLEAVAGEFGVSLPRHALVHGRLHTFTTRSWTRPPRNGETYMVIRMERGDAGPADSERTGEDGPGSR